MSLPRFLDLYTAGVAVTVAVTGVSASGAVGSVTASSSGIFVTGVEATASVGSVNIPSPHIRQQIRSRIETILTSGVTLASGGVYASRVYPLTEANLPAVTIYSGSEASGLQTMGVKTLARDLSLIIDAYVRVTDTFDDDVDAMCVQIEETIAADYTLNGLAKNTVLTSTEIDFDGDAERPVGVARLTYTIRYVSSIGDVETAR